MRCRNDKFLWMNRYFSLKQKQFSRRVKPYVVTYSGNEVILYRCFTAEMFKAAEKDTEMHFLPSSLLNHCRPSTLAPSMH